VTAFTGLAETARLVRAGAVSAREVALAALERIERLDPALHAFVTVARDQALAAADALDAGRRRGAPPGPLHGVPVAIKDTLETEGIRTTYGSVLHADHVPAEDQLCVARLRAAGAIVIGKTNTPVFAIGPVTRNDLAGLCRNPHRLDRSPGGSSGGSAAAVAAGLCAGAVGSDLGGSLRVPASFCGIVSIRPSPGRIPQYPKLAAWDTLNVNGPMARSVADVALMLAVMAGPDPRDPVSLAEPGDYLAAAPGGARGRDLRVAWSADLGGVIPVQRAVRTTCERALAAAAELGWKVEEAHPDTGEVQEAWDRARAFLLIHTHHRHVREHREQLSEHIVWNVEQWQHLSALEVGLAEQARTRIFHAVRRFLEVHDLLITPTITVEPWPAEASAPSEIDGVPMPNYYAAGRLSWTFSLLGLPALSLPCGRTEAGLPVGLQIVGAHRGEGAVLAAAHALEAALGLDMAPPPPFGV
jgi:amidase